MNKRELVRDMVVATRDRLRDDGWAVGFEKDMESPIGRSVSVKIRVHDDLRRTVDFLDTVVGERLVDWVTIHPRTRHTPSSTPIKVDALDFLVDKYKDRVPILLSGDVFDLAELPVAKTPGDGLRGFMSARGLLANPALFAGYTSCPWEAVERLMCALARAPVPFKLALHHVQQMVSPGMGRDKKALLSKKERVVLNAVENMVGLVDFLDGVFVEKTGREMRRDFLQSPYNITVHRNG